MKFSRISFYTLVAALAAVFTSCLGSGEQRETITYNYTDCFNVVTDLATGTSEIRLSPSYQLEINLTDGTANIFMNNISLPGVSGALSFKIEDVKFTFDNRGYYVIQGTNLQPGGSAGSFYTFSNLSIKFVDRLLEEGGARIPAYYINYTLNGTTQVNAVSTVNYYFGKTVVTAAGDENPFETYQTYYTVVLDPQSKTAIVGLRNAKFSDKMPVSLNFSLRNLPFTVDERGYKIEKAEATTPQINDQTPNPNFNITNLSVDGVTYRGADMAFDCNPQGLGDYHVTANLEWLIYKLDIEQ